MLEALLMVEIEKEERANIKITMTEDQEDGTHDLATKA